MSKPNVTRVQSATQWTASVHTLHMSKPSVTRVQSATQWTASVHTLHMSKPNVTRVQSAAQWTASVHTLHMSKPNVTRVQSATQWTASVHTSFGFRLSASGFWLSFFIFRLSAFGFRFLAFVFHLPASGFWLSFFIFRLSAFGFRFLAFVFPLPAFGFRFSAYGFPLSVFGLWLVACGFWLTPYSWRLPAFGFRLSVFGFRSTDPPPLTSLRLMSHSRTAWSSRFQILPGFNFELIERASGHRKCQQNELYVHIDIAGVMKYLRSAAWLLWNRLTISKSSFFFNTYCLLLLEGAECAVLSFWLQDPNWKVQGVLGSWMAGSKESRESASSFCIPFCRNSSKKICYWTRWDCLDFGHWCSKLGLKGGVSKMFQSALFILQEWRFPPRPGYFVTLRDHFVAGWFGRYDRPKPNCSSWNKNQTPLRRGARA